MPPGYGVGVGNKGTSGTGTTYKFSPASRTSAPIKRAFLFQKKKLNEPLSIPKYKGHYSRSENNPGGLIRFCEDPPNLN